MIRRSYELFDADILCAGDLVSIVSHDAINYEGPSVHGVVDNWVFDRLGKEDEQQYCSKAQILGVIVHSYSMYGMWDDLDWSFGHLWTPTLRILSEEIPYYGTKFSVKIYREDKVIEPKLFSTIHSEGRAWPL